MMYGRIWDETTLRRDLKMSRENEIVITYVIGALVATIFLMALGVKSLFILGSVWALGFVWAIVAEMIERRRSG